MKFEYANGATPLDPDEIAGLIPTHITTQGELNEWEQTNILQGLRWAVQQKRRELLDEGFVRDLHQHMLGQTWKWADHPNFAALQHFFACQGYLSR